MERLRLLSDLVSELALSTGDYEALLALCARRLSERFGDLCIIRLVSADGKYLEPSVAVHSPDPEAVEAARKATASRELLEANAFIHRVIEAGAPMLAPHIMDPKVLRDASPARRALIEQLGITGIVVAPLISHGKAIGVASLTRRGGIPYDDDDLRLMQDIATHAAFAIEAARTNHTLAEAARAHQLLFEASPVPVLVYDPETLLPIAVNEATLELFGRTKEEFLRTEVCGLVGLDRATAREKLAALGDREASGTARYVRADGSEIVAEYTARSVPFAGRRARITVLKDVSARSEAEATRATLAAIVESSNDSIVSCALDGTVLTWNDAAQRLFGYPAHEMIGKPFHVVVPEERREEDDAAVGRALRGEHVGPRETKRTRRDGSTVHVAVSLAPIRDAFGRVFAIARTARDLTAEREAAEALERSETHLRQAQKMDAIGRLAGGVAHDFNNMLAVILSYCSLIIEELQPGDPYADELREIEHAATRAADLTRQLLVFSRQTVVEPRVVDLSRQVEGMRKMLARIVGEDITLSFVGAPDLGSIRIDPSHVDQVVLNLVVNARDAMPHGGKLAIQTREDVVAGEPFVVLEVTDTGIGMDDALQARIFEPFFTTKAAGKGTGLGLATVFGIAAQCGGSVHVTSAPGAGSTFTVYFPRVEACDEDDVPKRVVVASRHATILLVEDEPLVLAVAQKILRKEGYDVLVATCPSEALRICGEHRGIIDLLLTDVVMPQMNGAELAQRVGKLRRETKALCMSGYTDSAARDAVVAAGISFLQKPFTPQTLTKKVAEALAEPAMLVVH